MKFSPRHVLAAATLVLLAACGGGGTQVDPFQPKRLIVFGDENSLLTPNGKRYAVNATKLENGLTTVDCAANPIWLQTVAGGFGLVLAACNPNNAAVNSLQYAEVGATTAKVRAQIDRHFAGGGVNARDLITVFVGVHDILELYAQFPAQTGSQLVAQAGERGRALAAQVNRLANANGRVLILTIPNLGITPFAIAERAARTDTDRLELLRALSNEFNRQLRLSLLDDGRLIGLVLADELADGLAQFPNSPSVNFSNVSQGVCAVALPDCTDQTLVPTGDARGWMWADSLRMGTLAHSLIGSSALTRAARNPF